MKQFLSPVAAVIACTALISGLALLIAMIVMFIGGRAFRALVAVAFLAASWSMFGRPFFRSRYRKALSKNLPTWTIEPD